MIIRKAIPALVCTLAFSALNAHASVAEFKLNATPGDYISGGRSVDNIYSSTTPLLIWNWAQFNNIGTAASPVTNDVSFTFLLSPTQVRDDEYADLEFSTRQLGTAMGLGTYVNAERAPFAASGHAGLEINYDHRGCNTLTGSYTINNMTFKDGKIDLFSATFSQSCDGGALMTGSFNYDAEHTSFGAVPEPGTVALIGISLLGLTLTRRRRHS